MQQARIAALLVLATCGCEQILGIRDLQLVDGGGSGGSGTPDGGRTVDGGNPVDAFIPTSDASKCAPVEPSYAPTFGSGDQGAGLEAAQPPTFTQELVWEGQLTATPPVVLEVEIVGGGGSTNTPDWPSALGPLQDIDLSKQTDAFVLILADIGSDNMPHDVYLAEAGILNIDTAQYVAGTTFSGTANSLQLHHVDIGSNTVDDPDGCTSEIPSFSFSAIAQSQ